MNKKVRLLLITDFINVYGFSTFSPLYALYAVHLGASAAQAAFIWSIYSLVGGVFTIIFGRIENLSRNKVRIVIQGFILQALATLILVSVENERGLIFSLIIYAIGNGYTLPAWKALFAKLVDRGKETQEWGLSDGGNSLVAALAAATAGIVIKFYGFRGILIVVAVAHFCGAILVSHLGRRKKRR